MGSSSLAEASGGFSKEVTTELRSEKSHSHVKGGEGREEREGQEAWVQMQGLK